MAGNSLNGAGERKRSNGTRPPPRVRHEPPTIQEALAAAEGITPDRDQQVEIAASLMGVPVGAVQSLIATRPREVPGSVRRLGRTIVVERKSRATLRRSA